MDPYLEQRLRDEVIYLHSLWRQGPPNRRNPNSYPYPNPNPNSYPNPNPNPNSYPNPNPNPTATNTIRVRTNGRNPAQPDPPPQLPYPCPATKRKRRDEIEIPSNKKPSQPGPDPRWQCASPAQRDDSSSAPATSTQWPSRSTKVNLAPASAEEQARHHALRLHNACLRFFRGNADAEENESEEEEEDGDCRVGDGEDDEEYKVLLNLFVEKSELRSYYDVNWENGDFYCLVCGGLGKMKRVKGCVGLVQHSISISNTKKKRAHRAFAQVVCRVLGWDFGRLPAIVLNGERLSLSLAKPGDEQGEPEVNADSSEGVLGAVEDNVGAERDANVESGEKEGFDEDLMLCQKSLKDDDANQYKENLDKGLSETKEDTEEAVDMRGEPEVNTDQLDSVVRKDNVAAENDAIAESSEKEAFDDHQCIDKEPTICQNSLKDDGTDKSAESLDEGKGISIEEAIQEEAKDASGEPEMSTGSCEGVLGGAKQNVSAENDANAELGEKEAFDDHHINSENQMICQNSLKDDGTNENTESLGKGISEAEANKEDAVDTRFEIEENADDYKHDLVLSKENLDTISGYTGEIGSKDEPEVAVSDETPMACELQAESENNVDCANEDLNVFLENLEPL
ncbi:hypothetical protein M0R45_014611 [Rubus argutus]|uniref:Uncharacterized protein n=1 Tax=Rubus argutus TaxID=59490 RepID=A0AAW1XPC1_RUBAR